MPEIRNRVKRKLEAILTYDETNTIEKVMTILSIPELAIVDREAKPPRCPVVMEEGLKPEIAELRQYTINQYYLTEELMLKAGWVKEDKE